jgi:rhamnulokinase
MPGLSFWKRYFTLTDANAFAAIDLGAESGRVIVGQVEDGSVHLHEMHRFANHPVRLPDGLHWNILGVLREALHGLGAAGRDHQLRGIGVDAWGVDYALLDERFRVLGLPFHYRDARTEGMAQRAFERVPREELFAATGIQTMPINTVFQLLADEGTRMLESAQSIALIPDLLALWLCGELANETTVASTTGLMRADGARWAYGVIDGLGLPQRPFRGLVKSGTHLGGLLGHHSEETGLDAGVPVFAVAGHDTASAFVAAPMRDRACSAVLCSGTWSLLGMELEEPVLSTAALEANLTNERGLDHTIRLLKNVMGLWLVQECRRAWGESVSYEELHRLAEDSDATVPLFDPDREEFLSPGDMPRRIAEACLTAAQDPPEGRGPIVRSVLVSLACKYRFVLEHIERVTGRSAECLHVIGGGAHNELLCQLTADVLGRSVLAGPAEASALGNVLVQARACGLFGSVEEMRAAVLATAVPEVYEPRRRDRERNEATYQRFS